MKIKLHKFDFSTIPPDGRIILVIGKRGSGKSTLIENIAYNLRMRFDFAIGMSPTLSSITMLEKHIPPAMVFGKGFNMDTFKKLLGITAQISRSKKFRKSLLLMDDCNADREAFRSKEMRDAFMNGRHYDINIIWAMHYCMDILPALRTQVDYVFVLKDNIRANKERLHRNFFGMFNKVDEFIQVMDKCTENNECLVLDNTSPTPDLSKCLFWYKGLHQTLIPPFILGNSVFFKLSDYYHKDDTADDDDLLKVKIRPGYEPINPLVQQIDKSIEGVEKI